MEGEGAVSTSNAGINLLFSLPPPSFYGLITDQNIDVFKCRLLYDKNLLQNQSETKSCTFPLFVMVSSAGVLVITFIVVLCVIVRGIAPEQ